MGAEIASATLFVVSTPIGNLSDMTFRAVETLKSVAVIACEDTRVTRVLCDRYDIKTRLISYHKFSETQKLDLFLTHLREGKSIALVSDAGTPLISDPGVKLVEAVRFEGFNVVPIVGASAILALLASIPRTGEDFKFVGFLPRGESQIETLLKSNRAENLAFYESPNRLLSTLEVVSNVRNGSKVAIGRELTKKFEEIKIDTPQNLIEYYNSHVLKGEIVCLVYAEDENLAQESEIKDKIKSLKALKLSNKDIASVLSTLFDYPKNTIKELIMKAG